MLAGTLYYGPLLWAGLGMAGYGLVYFLVHDVLVHRRVAHGFVPRNGYLRRIYQAHRLHHATHGKDGRFLSASSIRRRPKSWPPS